jgi:PAS domain-containing protein
MKSQSATRQDPLKIEPTDEKGSSPSFGPSMDSERVLGRFGNVAMMAADWFWEMDAELRFTYQSSRFEEITGIPVAD